MKSLYLYIVSAAFVALTLVGCKPTERNYQMAYDAAKAKREQAAAEQMRPATGLLNDEGPQLRVVYGDSIFVLHEMLSLPEGGRPSDRWALAVGVFKMDTNAKAAANDLKSHGFENAFLAKARGDKYYTIAATAPTMDSLRTVSKRFQKTFPDYPYVGLPAAPVLVSF